MAHKHERSDWYNGSFRRDSGGGALRRKHRGMRVTMLVLCVLILLVASSIIFRDRNEHAARQDILLPSPDSGFTNPRPDALPDITEAPADPDDYEDFREFFRRYYSGEAASSVPKASGSSIRRAELTGDFLPELVSAEGREELSLTQLYKACADAVVGIRASANSFGYSWGSGVLISPKGYILTNQHILEGNRRAEVILTDGRKLEALLVGEDLFTDIAVLKVESETPLPWVELGDSEALSVGDRVVAIGSRHASDVVSPGHQPPVAHLVRRLRAGHTGLADVRSMGNKILAVHRRLHHVGVFHSRDRDKFPWLGFRRCRDLIYISVTA